ncbi:uncharacterized protein PHALS_08964 [Plasmopara halstedii]|uniref:Phox homologous domain n=1 Tax=Plasmopara halstedii TaxID=4781 RepID=A0A0P1AED8_PLAHL|nr:uncharacterized protein PHALS_08964 [Plasmopara halstedii]CEG38919.1 hypothetical protein PHALS_08964 [Plasmopara halstedii]|eukprot:XP_024575288.1 hypothetical protein PHALS_08964 [Plasmopara halstedii]
MAVKDAVEDEQDLTALSVDLHSITATLSQRKDTKGSPVTTRLLTLLTSERLMLRELQLAPVTVYPQRVSRAMEIRLCLSRIEYIAIREVITREEGTSYFVLDVYLYRQQKGLPSSRRKLFSNSSKRLADCEPQNRKPDYHIEQRYSSFARLRSNVSHSARKHHPLCKACAYCTSVLDFLHMTPCKPSLRVKFTTTTEERKAILSSFINELVYNVREDYTSCPRSSSGFHIIPAIVKRFLSKQTGETFFS